MNNRQILIIDRGDKLKTDQRKYYEEKTKIFGKICVNLGLSANVLSLIGTLFGLLAGIFIWIDRFIFALLSLLASGVFDILDGATARYSKTCSPFGTLFDRVNDRYVEFFIALGCMGSDRVHPFWVVFSITGIFMASYVRACAESAGKVRNCDIGLMGRKEKAIVFSIGLLLEPILNPSGLEAVSLNPLIFLNKDGVLILQSLIILVGLLSHITAYQRLRFAKKHGH